MFEVGVGVIIYPFTQLLKGGDVAQTIGFLIQFVLNSTSCTIIHHISHMHTSDPGMSQISSVSSRWNCRSRGGFVY